ncbi:hypothetical protein FRB91_008972 [Serendipita sp. 411]|nr:hypothetical protein FRC19_010748 [Serendipita sp. 401]KAG8837539.1 hypothetical protein FRC18_008984 [Serendipita sp. 400]KAG8859006.1 hypothetical protein FRB91_008972 [Serendipita sp. 411]KAG9057748.1 hypothetical protein FS842_004404 [Serendipita sp. 407]
MASPISSKISPSSSIMLERAPVQQQLPPTLTGQGAVDKLAAQAKISQLAAQLRLRLSYANYKTEHKLSTVPFSTLEKRLEETAATARQETASFTIDPLALDKSLVDSRRMPPPPTMAPSLYTTLLDTDVDTRPTKRQKTDATGTARAIGPSTAGFTQVRPDIKVNGRRHHSPDGKSHSKGSNPSPRKKQKRESMAIADREQLALKTLTSLLEAKSSPKSPEKAPSDRSSTTGGGSERKTKTIRRTSSSVSSIDAAMADTTLSISGETAEGSTSGMDTVPGSPIMSAAQRERDSAELLLLLATSPSPVRNTTRRGPPPTGQGNGVGTSIEPRALFSEGSSSTTSNSSPNKNGGGDTGASTSKSASSILNNTASLLLPPPPSPTKKGTSLVSAERDEERYVVSPPLGMYPPAASSSKSPALQAPFTPHTGGTPIATNFGSATGGFGSGFVMGLASLGPSTPTPGMSFNMADYINFTPGFSPGPKPTSKAGRTEETAGDNTASQPGFASIQSSPAKRKDDREEDKGSVTRSVADAEQASSRKHHSADTDPTKPKR